MEELINYKNRIKATIISPLSIGQGEEKDWIEGIDYIREDKVLYHLDLQMIADAGIPMSEISALFASNRIDEIKNLLISKLDDIYDFSMDMPIPSVNPIKSFYFNPIIGKYTLFGSSLKGAIRSCLFHFLTNQEDATHLKQIKGLDEFVFGKMKDGSDFMRFIRIGDFEFDNTVLVNSKIYNLHYDEENNWIGGWKHKGGKDSFTDTYYNPKGFNTIYECLKPNESSEGSIMISPLLYGKTSSLGNFIEKKRRIMMSNPINKLFGIINASTQEYLEKEILFFEKYREGERSDEIIESLDHLKTIVSSFVDSDSKECLLKMAAGSGFHSITGDWQYVDYSDTGYHSFGKNLGKQKYKSRRIASYKGRLTPMGFIKLAVI